MIQLIDVTGGKAVGGQIRLRYAVSHSTPGRDGTTVTADLTVNVYPDRTVRAALDFGEITGTTQGEALDRLASWCERTAIALRDRSAGTPGLLL